VLANGTCIQALGRDQSIRGIKHLDWRPDFVLVTDFEDPEHIQTESGRRKTLRWFLRELLPACAPVSRKVRVHTTPLDPESVPMLLIRDDHWPHRVFPVSYIGEDGEETASWPQAYPLSWIERTRQRYRRLGDIECWEQEYMCRAFSEEARVFRKDEIRVEWRERRWEGVQAMIDPGRAQTKWSATTGWAAWRWVSPTRCVVWEGVRTNYCPIRSSISPSGLTRNCGPLRSGSKRTP
jgi:hypothetical protein